MHPDLSTHLHSAECTELINALKKCHTEKSFAKFWGACNEINDAMLYCLKQERLRKRRLNFEKSMFVKQRKYFDEKSDSSKHSEN